MKEDLGQHQHTTKGTGHPIEGWLTIFPFPHLTQLGFILSIYLSFIILKYKWGKILSAYLVTLIRISL